MKRRIYIITLLVALLVLAACHSPRREARRMVARAAALADTLPDSTARLIDSVLRMPVYFSERQRMGMALLQGEALFRDAPLDDDGFEDTAYRVATSPELERAADYYAKKKRYAKAAHAALYSGYVQQHYNEKEAAMRSYKDAEQYGLLSNDSLTVARAEYRMGKMMFDEYMENEALTILEKSENYFGNHFAERALVQNMMAVSYIILGQYENAAVCLKQSLEYSERGKSSKIKKKVLNNYAVLLRLQGEFSQALDCLRKITKESKLDDTETILLYKNMGDVFVSMTMTDSAATYYMQLDELLPTVQVKDETRISSYGALFQFAQSQGDLPAALVYKNKHEDCLYDMMSRIAERALLRIQQQYDYESLRNSMNYKIIQRQRIISVLSVVLALFLAALGITRFKLAQSTKNEAEIKSSLYRFVQENNELAAQSEEYKSQHHDLEQKLALSRLKEQRVMQKLAVYLDNRRETALLDSLKHSLMGNQGYWEAMLKLFDKQFPGTRKELERRHPELTEKELKVLLLSYLDTSREDTALLLDISVYMVDKLRNNVRKKMSQSLD